MAQRDQDVKPEIGQLLAAIEENTRAQRVSQIVGLASLLVGAAFGLELLFRRPRRSVIDVHAVEV